MIQSSPQCARREKGHPFRLPWVNPYVDAEDICRVFSLAPGKGKVWQIDTGSGQHRSHTCNDHDPFELMSRVGLFVANTVMTSGVLVGSFPEPAAPGYHLYPRASPHPVELNLFWVPYTATARTLEKVCSHLRLGLPHLQRPSIALSRAWRSRHD